MQEALVLLSCDTFTCIASLRDEQKVHVHVLSLMLRSHLQKEEKHVVDLERISGPTQKNSMSCDSILIMYIPTIVHYGI